MWTKGSVGRRTTATVSFRTKINPGKLVHGNSLWSGGEADSKNFNPTFWPAKNWVDLADASNAFGVNLALTAPAAIHAGRTATWNWSCSAMVHRNGFMGGRCWLSRSAALTRTSMLLIMLSGRTGASLGLFAAPGPKPREAMNDCWIDPQAPDLQKLADSLVRLDREDVVVSVVKKAESGDGVIVRLFKYADASVSVGLDFNGKPIKQAFLADALERPQKPLTVKDGKVQVEMTSALATILLKF